MKIAFLISLLCWLANPLFAQNDKYSSQRELRGSGTIIQQKRTVAPFQAIDIHPFLSTVTVEVGGTESSVSVKFDDNFKSFLQIKSVDGVLKLEFKDPDNKPFWLSKGTIDVNIKTPSLNQLRNGTNGDVVVSNLTGDAFSLTNQGNGNVTLSGVVKQLNVISEANGDVRAQKLVVQKASLITQANATIVVNARQLSAQKSAHATIRNVAGTPTRSVSSKAEQAQPEGDLVTVILQNNSPTSRTFTLRFTEPDNPIYAVISTTLGPYGKRRETYPVGTKIEQLNPEQQKVGMTGGDVRGRPIATLTSGDNGRAYNLLD